MSKISLIIKREYLTRVKKSSFIVMTLIGPVLFAGMLVIPTLVHLLEGNNVQRVAVIDHTGLYEGAIPDGDNLTFEYLPAAMEKVLREEMGSAGFDAFIAIEANLLEKPGAISIVSDRQVTHDTRAHVERTLRETLREQKLSSFNHQGLDTIIAAINNVDVSVTTIKIDEDGTERESSAIIAMIISFVFAFMSYILIFIYGSMVLKGVMEEKSNRVVEIIVSSVKPFELMLGKITGIALVALTQFMLWIGLTVFLVWVVAPLVTDPGNALTRTPGVEIMTTPGIATTPAVETGGIEGLNHSRIMEMIRTINPLKTMLLFLFYFAGGYLIYAALFAAIGSAIDNETDSQQFIIPVSIPVILALYVSMAAFRDPDSALVFWFSMFPLTSPIVMMARIPFEVPAWQIAVSMALLVAGFLFTTWFAARVYRTGILMYGKKVNYKELWKWFRYAGK